MPNLSTSNNDNPTSLIKLTGITKEYNGVIVLKGIDLTIEENEFVTLLGPSGCGKTTTLRIIGGFEHPNSGTIELNGRDLLQLPPNKRPTNTVFQKYALFPHYNVFENVAFGLRIKRNHSVDTNEQIIQLNNRYKAMIENVYSAEEIKQIKKEQKEEIASIYNTNSYKKSQINLLKKKLSEIDSEDPEADSKALKLNEQIESIRETLLTKKEREAQIEKKVLKYLKMVGLEGFEKRSINKLSGGQAQRVAIARALINEPQVLLLDEPLAALDLKLRQEMQYELKELQLKAGITFIFVTHDQEEALTMSDKIVVMNNGEIQQIGTPENIYNEPKNRFVAQFIGESNIIEGIMKDDFLVHFDGQDYICVDKGFAKNEEVDVVIRPEDIDIVPVGQGPLTGVVDSVAFKGVHYEIDVVTPARTYTIHTTDYHEMLEKVSLTFNPEDIHIMERSNGH
jgi:spermidine/putrescine transport system ATP-binding protein